MLRRFLDAIVRTTGASAVSLFIEVKGRNVSPPCLIHAGKLKPVPELASVDQARASILAFDAKPREANLTAEPPHVARYYKSAAPDGHLIRINVSRSWNGDGERVLNHLPESAAGREELLVSEYLWIGLRVEKRRLPAFLEEPSKAPTADTKGVNFPVNARFPFFLLSAAQLAWEVHWLSELLLDPVTGLPNRSEFQFYIKSELAVAEGNRSSLALMLISPEQFAMVNQRVGRDKGNSTLFEVAAKFASALSESDKAFHFGGATFAAVMRLKRGSDGLYAAERVRSTMQRYSFLEGSLQLSFSAGIAVFEGQLEQETAIDSNELLHRAEWAFTMARAEGGTRTVQWFDDDKEKRAEGASQLSGIYTGDLRKDYRNMRLLWDTVQTMSATAEIQFTASEFVEKISSAFDTTCVGLLTDGSKGIPDLLAEYTDVGPSLAKRRNQGWFAEKEIYDLLYRVRSQRRPAQTICSGDRTQQGSSHVVYVIPLIGWNSYLGCLWLEGEKDLFVLDSTDMLFLSALARQVALAIDRARLLARWQREKERETSRLRNEVRNLRKASDKPEIVYQSPRMQSVLEDLDRVARTDTTVLIDGPSGSGKELLAKYLHEQSLRAKGPLVIVDCGAIAPTLFETELFGHQKGAYTGADKSSAGRIVLAEGGTVFLDEVGELPVDVQAKLLRFVQEKELTAVGDTHPRKVDVRIVAATNRDLDAEVAAGRFRSDLYYRLQVVCVTAPPLRERSEDVLLLAKHFLELFALDYNKQPLRLSPEAEIALVDYPWPGNVRELKNKILQAVLLANGEEIGSRDLRLSVGMNESPSLGPDQDPQGSSSMTTGQPGTPSKTSYGTERPKAFEMPPSAVYEDDPWRALNEILRWLVDSVIWKGERTRRPLGRWLTEDIVLTADEAAEGVARQGASMLGMAESTFRRHLNKAKDAIEAGESSRSKDWLHVQSILPVLLKLSERAPGEDIVMKARYLLFNEVVAQVEKDDKLGAALMGITVPTYRNWKAQLGPGGIEPIS